jgi:hypothetical protein
MGLSRGEIISIIHIAADSLGNFIYFKITGTQVHDSKISEQLINNLIVNKGYDSDVIREKTRSKKMLPMIPRRKKSNKNNPKFNSDLYKHRLLGKNLFAKMKHFRNLVTSLKNLARNYRSMVLIYCT